MSVPNAVLSRYFLRQRVGGVRWRRAPPAPWPTRAIRAETRRAISSGKGWMLSQMPRSAISLAVASSIRWPCSMHFTPAAIGALDRGRRVGVHGDVGSPVFGGFDGGAQLGLGEGGHVERAVGGGDAAARGQLDLRRALHELLAHAHAHLVRAVGDHAGAELLHARRRAAEDARQLERLAEVAVTAGDGDDGAGREDARREDPSKIGCATPPRRTRPPRCVAAACVLRARLRRATRHRRPHRPVQRPRTNDSRPIMRPAAASSVWVYASRGAANSASASPCSTIVAVLHHQHAVRHRAHHGEVVADEHVAHAVAAAAARASSASTCCCTDTSSAEVGSSSTSTSGRSTTARAIAMRWRWPPENSCG